MAAKVSEHLEQSRFFAVLRRMEPLYPQVKGAFAIPNGFLDTKAKRIRAFREGVLSGVPDVFIPWPIGGFHGLFLEFKRAEGRVTKGQEEYLALMRSRGYKAEVVFGLREALEVLKGYIAQGAHGDRKAQEVQEGHGAQGDRKAQEAQEAQEGHGAHGDRKAQEGSAGEKAEKAEKSEEAKKS
jgi:hypothetical protein